MNYVSDDYIIIIKQTLYKVIKHKHNRNGISNQIIVIIRATNIMTVLINNKNIEKH